MKRTRKRTLLPRMTRMVLLLLAGGAIINVAVAWGCAVIAPEEPSSRTPMNVNSWPQPVLKGWPHKPVVFNAYFQFSLCFSWEEFRAREENSSGNTLMKNQYTLQKLWVGLPFRCATGDVWRESRETNAPGSVPTTHLGYWYGGMKSGGTTKPFPVRPVWPGFAINTIFYAAILWLLFAAPGFVRRRIRARRRQCPACVYPIGASNVCTECGAVLPLPEGEGD